MGIKKFITLISLLSLVVFPVVLTTPVSAGYITLSHEVTMERIIKGDKTTVNITLTNSGDESAHDVQLSLLLPKGVGSEPIFFGKVDPNIAQSGTFDIEINPGAIPGKYSMVILTEYKDANGYPFSSVSPNSMILKKATSSQISGMISELTLGNKQTKKLTLNLRNMDPKDHNLQIRLFIPRELKIDSEQESIVLKAREEKKMDFRLSSFGALPGSSYVVFAAIDYEDGGVHYSSTSWGGLVKVVEGGSSHIESGGIPFGISFWILMVSFIVLLAVFVYLKFIRKEKEGEKGSE